MKIDLTVSNDDDGNAFATAKKAYRKKKIQSC